MISIDKDIRDCFLSSLLKQLFLDGRPVIHLVQVEQTVGQTLIFEVGFHSGPERAVRLGKDHDGIVFDVIVDELGQAAITVCDRWHLGVYSSTSSSYQLF